jgi:hypothetical protein
MQKNRAVRRNRAANLPESVSCKRVFFHLPDPPGSRTICLFDAAKLRKRRAVPPAACPPRAAFRRILTENSELVRPPASLFSQIRGLIEREVVG